MNVESTSNQPSSSSRLVLCNCPKCNGRLIDSRTKNISKKTYKSTKISNITADNEVLNISSEDEMEEMEEISIESEEESADKFSNIFEDYSSPNYDFDELIDPKSTNNNSYL
ncbi:hypothetical protein Glove_186g69 [Diversispora epigaea]|uniref:Uncharacterized protein n=1 Tax=Diversispora epigaea TaxID=1348612 RepID=A0A397IM32_9GLOM|nr:hypothetical protein Glove_186g69 [Diversispora epigaea]